MLKNTWYVSDYGSDDNDCNSATTLCRNLQTVLDRATDGADIYVTSKTLSLDAVYINTTVYLDYIGDNNDHYKTFSCCGVVGSISYNISSISGSSVNVTCSGQYNQYFYSISSMNGYPVNVTCVTVVSVNPCTQGSERLVTDVGLLCQAPLVLGVCVTNTNLLLGQAPLDVVKRMAVLAPLCTLTPH